MKKNLPSKEQSYAMFDTISPSYDRINRILSLGRDLAWRKKLKQYLPCFSSLNILDLATGTGDQIFTFLPVKKVKKVIGLDLSRQMLDLARKKLEKKGEKNRWDLIHGDAQNLPFSEEQFEAVSISFGIRNMPDPKKALQEMLRVLKPKGRALILEFSLPQTPWVRKVHHFYLKSILPKVGGFLSKNPDSYEYLHQTITSFPYGKAFLDLMEEAGFYAPFQIPLNLGAVTLYVGEKESA